MRRTSPTVVAGTESQAAAEAGIEFVDGFPAEAFSDLAGFERIWLIFLFHRSEGWKAGSGRRVVAASAACWPRVRRTGPTPSACPPWSWSGSDEQVPACARHGSARRHADPRHQALRSLCRRVSRRAGRLDRRTSTPARGAIRRRARGHVRADRLSAGDARERLNVQLAGPRFSARDLVETAIGLGQTHFQRHARTERGRAQGEGDRCGRAILIDACDDVARSATSSASRSRIRNSSPPSRTTASCARTWRVRKAAMPFSTSSPRSWP